MINKIVHFKRIYSDSVMIQGMVIDKVDCPVYTGEGYNYVTGTKYMIADHKGIVYVVTPQCIGKIIGFSFE